MSNDDLDALVQAHLEQGEDSVAVMRSVRAESGTDLRGAVYLTATSLRRLEQRGDAVASAMLRRNGVLSAALR